jgi:hypothetical protein
LSTQFPARRDALLQLWRQERLRFGITLPEDL